MKISDLVNFGKKVLELFNNYTNKRDPKPQIRKFVRHFTTSLKISEYGCQSSGSSEIVQEPDWTYVVLDFINEKIKSLDDFTQLANSIAISYKTNINKLAPKCNEVAQSSLWLENFIRKIIHEKLEGKLSDDSLIDYASLFKSELELAPIDYKYIHNLSGIYLESESIKINDDVCIRKAKKADLEYLSDLLFDFPKSRSIPSSILEINISTQEQKECSVFINNIFNCLRLFKLGSILPIETETIKKTIIWPSAKSRSFSGEVYFAFKKYTIQESDVDIFTKFINYIVDKLYFDKNNKFFWSLGIAIDRYNSALLETTDSERRLMISVMGLESLFSLPKEKGENAYKLSIRVAKLLGFMNFEGRSVKKLIQQAYKFRNEVVHGLYMDQGKRKEINKILPEILNYLRISIIFFLLNQNINKGEMINKIDNSLIDINQSGVLNKLIERTTEEFKELLYNP